MSKVLLTQREIRLLIREALISEKLRYKKIGSLYDQGALWRMRQLFRNWGTSWDVARASRIEKTAMALSCYLGDLGEPLGSRGDPTMELGSGGVTEPQVRHSVYPPFMANVDAFLTTTPALAAYMPYRISRGYRTRVKQEEYYDAGSSQVRFGYHNVLYDDGGTVRRGALAVDVQPTLPAGKTLTDWENDLKASKTVADSLNLELGVFWTSLPDPWHIQAGPGHDGSGSLGSLERQTARLETRVRNWADSCKKATDSKPECERNCPAFTPTRREREWSGGDGDGGSGGGS